MVGSHEDWTSLGLSGSSVTSQRSVIQWHSFPEKGGILTKYTMYFYNFWKVYYRIEDKTTEQWKTTISQNNELKKKKKKKLHP